MSSELFARIKKLVRREGKVVFFDDEESYVLMPLADYEALTEDLCGEECECGKLDEEISVGEPEKNEEVDKELIRKVNEDIARWREEQASQEINKTKNQEIKTEENLVDLSEVAGEPEAKEEVLTEEERYYLEPLE